MGLLDFLRGESPQDAFAKRVMAKLAERGWPSPVSYDRKRFAIVVGGKGGTLNLGNLYPDWLTYPKEERESALDLVIAPLFEAPDDPKLEDVVDQLLPIVRNRCDLSLMRLEDGRGPGVATEALAGPLSVAVAIDRPTSMAFVNNEQLAEWGLSFSELIDRAVLNLEGRSPCRFERAPEGFYVSQFNDYYDPSRLLLPRLFDQLELRGAPVAVAVSRYCLVVADSDDADQLRAMAAYVDAAMLESNRPISYTPLVLRDGLWRPFAPPAADLVALRNLSAKQLIWDYGKQQQAMEAVSSPREVWVATCDSVRPGGEIVTWSTWAKGVPTLLPRTDYIGLTDQDLNLMRRWEDVEAVCGAFAAEAPHDPVRYFVDSWPDDAALQRLKTEFAAPEWSPD